MKYEFYIVELCISINKSNVFVIWVESEDEDIFLLDKEGYILAFDSLENVKNFINKSNKNASPLIESEFISYKQLFSNEVTYYSFPEIEKVFSRNKNINEIGENDTKMLIDGYNFISDYFYQIKDEEYLLLRKNQNIEMFFDYSYYKYFWKKGKEWIELKKKLKSFDYAKFVEIFKDMIDVFVKGIK
ncbi:hypothetical protein ACR79T_15650 [Sphingobacterium spiritivorum]|uniref:hypothetical protein n=1 Tax=Sphingobacterium spiritivorum TaxID=258 RepID=UPI003DA4E24B